MNVASILDSSLGLMVDIEGCQKSITLLDQPRTRKKNES
jgi:hypothetical protein